MNWMIQYRSGDAFIALREGAEKRLHDKLSGPIKIFDRYYKAKEFAQEHIQTRFFITPFNEDDFIMLEQCMYA